MPLWKQFRAVLLPLTMTLVVPGVLLALSRDMNIGGGQPAPVGMILLLVGGALVGAGLALVYQTVRLFIHIGEGTLAPWDPPNRLVIRGIYHYVRNPMISGVFCILLGEAIALGSGSLLLWSALFLLINLLYIPLVEEPGLVQRFGDDYRTYRQHVPRWLPRRTPWQPDTADKSTPHNPDFL